MLPIGSKPEPLYMKESYDDFIVSLSDIGNIENLGLSSDGVNNVYAVHIDSKANHNIVIDSAIHGQHEWTSAYWVRKFLQYLVNPEISYNPQLFNYLRNAFNWHVIPIANPFGYNSGVTEWMDKGDTMYRYNANGVDLNRNFPVNFDNTNEPKGTEPFSEVETQYIRDLVLKYKPVAYLNWHTYGAPTNLTATNTGMDDLKLHSDDFLKTFKFGTGENTRFGNPMENLPQAHNWAVTTISTLGIHCLATTPEISYENTFEKQMELGVFYNFAYFLHVDAFIKSKSLVNYQV